MFDNIFNRDQSPAKPDSKADQKAEDSAATASLKQEAMTRAAALAGDEAGSVEFILACPFADARAIAAEHVVSPAMLEQVQQAMRNTDRRVARLMQGRLDEIRQREFARRQARQCIEQARALVLETRLLANQVVDLDHAWQTILLVPEEESAEFAIERARLAERMAAQASLQHEVIELAARLKHALAPEAAPAVAPAPSTVPVAAAVQGEAAAESPAEVTPTEPSPKVDGQLTSPEDLLVQATNAMAQHRSAAEAASLPASLLKEVDAALLKLQTRLAKPVVAEAPAAPQAVAQPVATPAPIAKRPPKEDPPELRAQFATALAVLEKALAEGVLHDAQEADRSLRNPPLQACHPNEAQNTRLTAARAELGRLQGWARWGGNVSREELLKAAETMPAQKFPPAEIAVKVSSLREHWKALDVSAGPASKEVWLRFDAACSTAYAPAAAHFKKLAEERTNNQAKAQALLDTLKTQAAALPAPEAIDWKQLAHHVAQATQAWQRLGTMERKEKKRLDGQFTQALAPLKALLTERRADEITRREALITEAGTLNPSQRGALDQLRALQERWQTQAKVLPLERRDEQALWQRFRKACDVAFAARKEVAKAADVERREHQKAKEELCARLEAAAGLTEHDAQKVMREVREAWSKIGPVPRAHEKAVDSRHQAAVQALQQRVELAKRAQQQSLAHALHDKIGLCQRIEAAVVAGQAPDPALAASWDALPKLATEWEKVMSARFAAATKADSGYAAKLKLNQANLATELLRAEIVLGIQSPAELARERLALQVEVLRSSLKAGEKSQGGDAALLKLCGLAAAVDAGQAERLQKIVDRVRIDKK
jgi:hypothetical protein